MAIFMETDENHDAVLSVSEFSSVALISDGATATGGTAGAGAGARASGYYSAATQRNPAGADGPRYCCSLLKFISLLPSGGVRVADSTANFDAAVALCDWVLPRRQIVLTPSRFASGGIKLFAASDLNQVDPYHAREEIRKP